MIVMIYLYSPTTNDKLINQLTIQSPFPTRLKILFSKKYHTKTRSGKKTNKIDEDTGRTQQATDIHYLQRTKRGQLCKDKNKRKWN
jgi:hypothetical protein